MQGTPEDFNHPVLGEVYRQADTLSSILRIPVFITGVSPWQVGVANQVLYVSDSPEFLANVLRATINGVKLARVREDSVSRWGGVTLQESLEDFEKVA